MIGRRTKLGPSFMQLREPHAGHQVQLVDCQCLLQRGLLIAVIPGGAVRGGEIEPQGRLGRIGGRRRGQMVDRPFEIARLERVEPKLVEIIRVGPGQGLSAQ